MSVLFTFWYLSKLICLIHVAVYAMPMQTAIVGDERGRFVYQTADKTRGFIRSDGGHDCIVNAVALTFVKDSNNAHGTL